jgi:FkbM family methyltransferase
MGSVLKDLVANPMRRFIVGVARFSNLQRLKVKSRRRHKVEMLMAGQHSRSQLGQDLFALTEVGFKTNGYFVEFGATNGVDGSNSWLLEKQFAWSGVVAEPARCWHRQLQMNRSCIIETDCVWHESNSVLTFNEADLGEYSTIDTYTASDLHSQNRVDGKRYDVKTISLEDLLEKHGAPREIDYLSIDTEGSEYDILSCFNFDKYQFRVITCEHNFTPARDKIHDLLTRNGYRRKHRYGSIFDGWYVKA